jgi:hypothetical protein
VTTARRVARPLATVLAVAFALALGAGTHPLGAQVGPSTAVLVTAPPGDTLASVTPTFLVRAVNVGRVLPLSFRFEIDTTPRFTEPLVDTVRAVADSAVSFTPGRALAEGRRIWWRASVIDPSGASRTSAIGGPRVVPFWVTRVAPTGPSGVVVRTRRPRFIWRSPAVGEPPGPWEYSLEITNAGNRVLVVPRILDTTYVPQRDLEANAPYRWTITARLPGTGQATVVASPVTFVVEDSAVTATTLLYQNFPNPFPQGTVTSTCVWFDIERASTVRLEIYDLRGLLVRRLLPTAGAEERLPAGRYGRPTTATAGGCDERLEWDGTDGSGRTVPAGVYLLRFRADGVEEVKKILFRGR